MTDFIEFISTTYGLFFIIFLFLVFFIVIFRKRPIDEVRDERNKLLFTIYFNGTRYIVHDHYALFTRKIPFKTYIDVEAFINRRVNGWKIPSKSTLKL